MGLLDSVSQKLTEFVDNLPRFDPSSFNDEVAMKTDWGSIGGAATNFAAQKLVEVSSSRQEFRLSATGLLLPGAFFAVGAGIGYRGIDSGLGSGGIDLAQPLFLGAIGFLACGSSSFASSRRRESSTRRSAATGRGANNRSASRIATRTRAGCRRFTPSNC